MFQRQSRRAAVVALAIAVVTVLSGCSLLHSKPLVAPHATHTPRAGHTADATGGNAATLQADATPTPTTAPDPAQSHLATPEPSAPSVPAPYITQIAAGTPVVVGDMASPKGSIHFHYRVVTDGDGTYSVQYSSFTSTLPVPVAATFIDIAPGVGDGITWHGVGDHLLGGPTSAATSTSAALGTTTQPGYLGTLITYSAAPAGAAVPVEISSGKVLTVTPITWRIPQRQTNVHPVDHGASQFASGALTEKTAAGAPKQYRVADGDITSDVAARFGIPTSYLIWLNQGLEVFGAQQYLYAGTTINLDPQSR
jgi:LysM repeat protein